MPSSTVRRLLFAVPIAALIAAVWLRSAAPRLAAFPEAAARFQLFFVLLGLTLLGAFAPAARNTPRRTKPHGIIPFMGEKIP
jgi:hypothetical protein